MDTHISIAPVFCLPMTAVGPLRGFVRPTVRANRSKLSKILGGASGGKDGKPVSCAFS